MSLTVQILGTALVLVTLADIFLTVLYARSGTGLFTPALQRGIWRLFRSAPVRGRAERDRLLAYAGPAIMVTTAGAWFVILLAGFALIVWPELGGSVRAADGPTPRDFATAVYYSGFGLTTLGTGDIVPHTAGFRILLVAQAFLGFSILTLTLTYFMSVYSAIVRRNALADALHYLSGGSGDAADIIAGLGACGRFDDARGILGDIALRTCDLLESHHSYPVIHYFRGGAPNYAVPRLLLVLLDTSALLRSALHRDLDWLRESGAVTMLDGAAMALLDEWSRRSFIQSAGTDRESESDPGLRFGSAMRRLAAAGVPTADDSQGGVTRYAQLRGRWSDRIQALAGAMDHQWREIAPHEDVVRDGG